MFALVLARMLRGTLTVSWDDGPHGLLLRIHSRIYSIIIAVNRSLYVNDKSGERLANFPATAERLQRACFRAMVRRVMPLESRRVKERSTETKFVYSHFCNFLASHSRAICSAVPIC
jgi:hypothetical protein